jgi:hypothetical protein
LLPDLLSESVAHARDDVRVVELVRGVVVGLAGQLRCAGHHASDVLRGHVRPSLDGFDDDELGAEGLDQAETLFRVAVGDDDLAAVPFRAAHQGERWAGATARVLDDGRCRADEPVPLSALDHRHRHAILHRAGGIAVLELDPELGPVGRDAVLELDERRVADLPQDRAQSSPSM